MTPNAIATTAGRTLTLATLNAERKSVLQRWIAPGLTDPELEAYLSYCGSLDVDPFGKEIYVWKQDGKIVTHLGIDYLRRRAAESGEYEGQFGPEYTSDGEKWLSVWLKDGPPAAIRVGILRRGFREPLWGICVLKRDNRNIGKWKTDPIGMAEVTAERRAQKRAFPRELERIERSVASASQEHGFAVSEEEYVDTETGEIAPPAEYPQPEGAILWNAETGETLLHESDVRIVEPPTTPGPTPRVVREANLTPEQASARLDASMDAWKTAAAACWAKVKAWAAEHGTDPARLRYYVATDKGVPEKLTESAFKAWLDAAPGRDFDKLYVLYVDGERPLVGAEPEQPSMEHFK